MADFLDEKRKEIDARLRELRPLVEEFNRLEKAAAALAGVGGTQAAATQASLERSRTLAAGAAARAAAATAPSRRWSWCAPGPGITISELADAMGIKANYLYRVMPTLQKEGQVKKRDKGWYPA